VLLESNRAIREVEFGCFRYDGGNDEWKGCRTAGKGDWNWHGETDADPGLGYSLFRDGESAIAAAAAAEEPHKRKMVTISSTSETGHHDTVLDLDRRVLHAPNTL
jgi:hypothetical protein